MRLQQSCQRWFQHTAARRRLVFYLSSDRLNITGFNTQPPEGGWIKPFANFGFYSVFQHTAARRRLVSYNVIIRNRRCFNTQPPEGGWILRPF